MSGSCECCLLSGRGPCVGLITRPEASYQVWCVWVWSWSPDNEEALARQGLLSHWKKRNRVNLTCCRLAGRIRHTVITTLIATACKRHVNTCDSCILATLWERWTYTNTGHLFVFHRPSVNATQLKWIANVYLLMRPIFVAFTRLAYTWQAGRWRVNSQRR
jgi:hypothetical protein